MIDIYMTISANGMIALPDGDAPWSDETWAAYHALGKQYEAIVVGRVTYDIIKDLGDIESIGNPFVFVLSKNKHDDIPDNKTYYCQNVDEVQAQIKSKNISKTLVCGGADIVSLYMGEGDINDLILDIEPQVFNQGMNLLSTHRFFHRDLELKHVEKIANKIVRITYKCGDFRE